MGGHVAHPHLAHMEAIIGGEDDVPDRAVEGRAAGTGPLEDAVGQALDTKCIDILQPHQRPGSTVEVLSSRQLLLHLLEASMES